MPDSCAVLIDELIALRRARGWTQKDLSAACGLTQSVIGRIESKKSVPTLTTFCKIASALDATLSLTESTAYPMRASEEDI